MLSIIHVLRMDTPNLLFSEIKLRKQKNYDNKYSNWSLNSALKDYSPHSTENETIERYDQVSIFISTYTRMYIPYIIGFHNSSDNYYYFNLIYKNLLLL